MGATHLYLGWRSAILGLVAVQILVLAAMVLATPTRRPANRMLGLALVVVAGLLVPYAIGFAGAYDAWRWLTFAPFAVPLALGPSLYGYARGLEQGRVPRRLFWHFVPPLAQVAYYAICFLLPLDAKWNWYTGGHDRWVGPIFSLLTLVSLAAYAMAIGRVLTRYRSRLADQRSDDDRFSARWLSRVQTAIVLGLVVEVGFWLWSILTGGIDYFQETGLYVALGGLGLFLGLAGWRHAGLPVPLPIVDDLPATTSEAVRPATDWIAIAADVEDRTRAEGWWKDPGLTLPLLSARLGTNSGRLSRAINLGLDVNFSVFINSLRAEGVADALRTRPDVDLLDLAFEMGFASKASFNRAFQARYGMTPSFYRRQVSDPDFSPAAPDLRRAPVRARSF